MVLTITNAPTGYGSCDFLGEFFFFGIRLYRKNWNLVFKNFEAFKHEKDKRDTLDISSHSLLLFLITAY